jgi:hypothetical protein
VTTGRGRWPALAALALLAAPVPAEEAEPMSRYRVPIEALVARWGLTASEPTWPRSLALACLTTPGEESYVGARQEMLIEAPLTDVTSVLDDVPHYRDLFPDTVDVQVVPGSRRGTRFVTAWEQRAPVFFLPNTRFELVYQVERPDPARVAYRYWLRRSGTIRHSDGVVLLEALGPGRTRFIEYDFFDAAWGPVPLSLVWSETLKGMFLSDVAVKLKAEHPDWSHRRVATEAERRWSAEPELVDRCRAGAHEMRKPDL